MHWNFASRTEQNSLLKNFDNKILTVTKSNKSDPTTPKTLTLPFSNVAKLESTVLGKDEDI